jgi:hypothetical protein
MENNQRNSPQRNHGQDTKNDILRRTYRALFEKPKSRRMVATEIGYTDQTFMVTKPILDLIKSGRAQVVGMMKCSRSGEFVQAVTTNPAYFEIPKYKQGELF